MKISNSYLGLPSEIENLLLDFLDEDLLRFDANMLSAILSLRAVNKYFYNFINTYWTDKYHIKQIVCGDHNTYILLANGDLYGCGANGAKSWLECIQPNNHFRLGLPDRIKKSEKFVKVNKNVQEIFGGGQEILLVLTKDNKLYGTGNTHHLGLNRLYRSFSNRSDYDNGNLDLSGFKLKAPGKIFKYSYTQGFKEIASHLNIKIKKVSASRDHVIILDQEGKVYACGFNCYGKLGIDSDNNLDEFTLIFNGGEKIFATDFHTFIISNKGLLYVAGLNRYQFISNQLSVSESVRSLTLIHHVPKPRFLKNIACCALGYMFLYENGDLYLNILPSNKKGLIDININKMLVYYQDNLLLLKTDGSLLHLVLSPVVIEENLHLLNSNTNNLFLSIRSLSFILSWILNITCFPLMIANCFGPKITYFHSIVIREKNRVSLLSDFYRSNRLVAYDANTSDHSDFSNQLSPKGWGRFLFFTNKDSTKLYASGYECADGQLALTSSETQGFVEVFDNLPVKNKLLQGRSLIPKPAL